MSVTIRWHTADDQHEGYVFDADYRELLAQCPQLNGTRRESKT